MHTGRQSTEEPAIMYIPQISSTIWSHVVWQINSWACLTAKSIVEKLSWSWYEDANSSLQVGAWAMRKSSDQNVTRMISAGTAYILLPTTMSPNSCWTISLSTSLFMPDGLDSLHRQTTPQGRFSASLLNQCPSNVHRPSSHGFVNRHYFLLDQTFSYAFVRVKSRDWDPISQSYAAVSQPR